MILTSSIESWDCFSFLGLSVGLSVALYTPAWCVRRPLVTARFAADRKMVLMSTSAGTVTWYACRKCLSIDFKEEPSRSARSRTAFATARDKSVSAVTRSVLLCIPPGSLYELCPLLYTFRTTPSRTALSKCSETTSSW